MDERKRQSGAAKDMTKGSSLRLILVFSIPLLIGNVFQQLYNMVDTIIVGRCIDTAALAAVGTTGPLNFLVIGFIMGITSGFGVLVAQRFGAKDEDGLRKAAGMAAVLCMIITVLITALAVGTAMPLLRLINTPDDIIRDSYRYIVVIYIGIAATMLYNMLACVLRALGDSRTPLYFLIISSILNIGLDLLFILAFRMGVAGAAWATVISQGVSGVLCFFYTKKKYPMLHLTKEDFKWNGKIAAKHLQIGLPMAFQFTITAIGVVIVQGALNVFGTVKIAAYTAASKVAQLVTQPANTMGVTMANYAGQNLGADELDRIKDGVRKCTIVTLCFAVTAMGILFLFGRPLCSLFITNDGNREQVLSAAMEYLKISSMFFPFLFVIFVYRNVLQGIGKSFMPLMGGVFELAMRVGVAVTLPKRLGFFGVCLADPIAWAAAAIVLGISYFVIFGKILREHRAQKEKRASLTS
ncbi:MAG: MATE family efflux transporter [Lachnospiraceae bacterium]|nr:MATE family efflux transporter [Lachnospiraceae bacterium]